MGGCAARPGLHGVIEKKKRKGKWARPQPVHDPMFDRILVALALNCWVPVPPAAAWGCVCRGREYGVPRWPHRPQPVRNTHTHTHDSGVVTLNSRPVVEPDRVVSALAVDVRHEGAPGISRPGHAYSGVR